MTVIFVMPLLVSLFAAGYMAFASEAHPIWRVAVVVVILVADTLQLVDFFTATTHVHFLIPLLVQIFVSIGVIFWSAFEQSGW